MNKTLLIADSGGTQTDWCYINEKGEKHYFTTSSFHPVNVDAQFTDEYKVFWEQRPECKVANLRFYGAGCFGEENRKKIADLFHFWGFNDVQIFSDVEAACHALLGSGKGCVAIMGTGSVVCMYDGVKITELIGGYGYLLGDEGSGYYFGKMLLSAYLNGEFTEEVIKQLREVLGDRHKVISSVYGSGSKQYIGQLASKIAGLNELDEIKQLHEKNIQLFFDKYLMNKSELNRQISIAGRYGYYQIERIRCIAGLSGWEVKDVVDAPIVRLTEYSMRSTE